MKYLLYSAFFALLVISFFSCENEENETNISHYNDKRSHNMGRNCMNCHTSGGGGKGTFRIAGTVYDSTLTQIYKNPTIKLYTEPNGGGTLKYTIEGDAFGNFFTTENIDFGTGLYPSIEGNTETKYMGISISLGECNSCHGVSTHKLSIK